jgi:ADP-ribose pyrophosphatase YjhB (NUDIX family)
MPVADKITCHNFFVAGVLYKVTEHELFFLFVEQEWKGQIQLKFPGGCNKLQENPVETLAREIRGETGLSPVNADLIFKEEKISSNRQPFCRMFYLVNSYTGNILTQVRRMDEEEYDPELIGPPLWLKLEKSLADKIHPSHQIALMRALRHLLLRADSNLGHVIESSHII